MKQERTYVTCFASFVKNRVNLFYILAFPPIIAIFHYNPLGAIIPLYAFLLLMIKRDRLAALDEAQNIQRILGSIVAIGSFLIYYVLAPVSLEIIFYGIKNYVVYIFGLFLVFFRYTALKEAFTPIFLIVATTASPLIATGLKPYLSSFSNDFAHLIANILKAIGINAHVYSTGSAPVITFSSLSNTVINGVFVYECIGVYSMLLFSIILVVVLSEIPGGLKSKLIYSIIGLLGTFVLNVVRVTMIFLADYVYGAEVGSTIHYFIGYALFSAWIACFLYIFSKRQTVHLRVLALLRRIHPNLN